MKSMRTLGFLSLPVLTWAAFTEVPGVCEDGALLQPSKAQRPRRRRYGPREERKRKWRKAQKPHGFSLPFGYSIVGPGRSVVSRLLLPIDVPCPSELHLALGKKKQVVAVHVRAEPHVGMHGVWYTEGQRYQHLTDINYTYGNPISPFTYEDRVCEAGPFVPDFFGEDVRAAFHLQDGNLVRVPIPPRQPGRYLVIGDTGLRIKAENDGWCSENLGSPKDLYGAKTCPSESLLSNYNATLVEGLFQSTSSEADPAMNGWPFQEVCESMEKSSHYGDVMVHVGDYLYSHNACPFPFPEQIPAGEQRVFGDCTGVGDAWGDTSEAWIREFFGPAAGLLGRLPWIVLRGNHEECERSGHGWFRYLDPRPSETFQGGGDIYAPYCVSYSKPYNVEFEHDNWLVVDSSSVASEDISIDAYPPLEYTEAEARAAGTEPILSMDICDTKPTSGDDFINDFQELAQLSNPSASRQWFATHRPLFGLTFQNEGTGGQLYSFQCQLTDAAAKSNLSLPNIAAIVSGHFHSWQLVQFQQPRPAQLVAGNSGTQLATPRDGAPNGIFRAVGRPLLGANVSYSETVGEFGWTQLEVSSDGPGNAVMTAYFLADAAFEPQKPQMYRTLVPVALQVDQTWMQ